MIRLVYGSAESDNETSQCPACAERKTKMKIYRNKDGRSGILRYECGPDYIVVEFDQDRNRFYKYTNSSAGPSSVDHMKILAEQGQGLNSYINKNSYLSYESKW